MLYKKLSINVLILSEINVDLLQPHSIYLKTDIKENRNHKHSMGDIWVLSSDLCDSLMRLGKWTVMRKKH